MANVSPEAINNIANDLQSLISSLESSYQNILNSINDLTSSISMLQSYNGQDASPIFESINSLPGDMREIINFKYIWNIKITNASNVTALSSSSTITDIEEKIEMLSLSDQELFDASIIIASYITELVSILKDENINTIFQNQNYLNYLTKNKKIDYSNIKEDSYIPQGYTIIDGKYALISAYKKEENSRLYLYDKKTGEFLGMVILDNDAHVGGIMYDSDHDTLFVTNKSGKVDAYDYSKLQKYFIFSKHNEVIENINLAPKSLNSIRQTININEDPNGVLQDRAATVTYNNGKLYVGTFEKEGKIFEYDVSSSNGKLNIAKGNTYTANSAIQGMCSYDDGKDQYLYTASSAQGSKNSYVYKYKVNGENLELIGNKIIPQSGLEGISVDNNDNLNGIFEYGLQNTVTIDGTSITQLTIPQREEKFLALQADLFHKNEEVKDVSNYMERKNINVD